LEANYLPYKTIIDEDVIIDFSLRFILVTTVKIGSTVLERIQTHKANTVLCTIVSEFLSSSPYLKIFET
jgi:hypothetical protein